MTPQEKAFLDMLSWSEGTINGANGGYGVIVTGVDGPESFTDYSNHPFANGRTAKLINPNANPPLFSTASGRYQLLLRWWRGYQQMLHLPDFSPASQDAVALRQMQERGARTHLADGDVQGAIVACSNIWASLPGNDYGQAGGHTMEELVAKYNEFLAVSENQA